jgi:hypothetical protein
MSEFDDRELRDALRRRAGAVTDGFGIEAARATVVARAARVRRRRTAVAGGAAMAGLIAAAVVLVGPGTDSVVTSPADQTDASRPAPIDSSVDTTAPPTTDPAPTTPADMIDTTPPVDTSPSPVTTVPTVNPPTATSTTAPATTAPPASDTTVFVPPTTPAPTPPTTPTTSVPGTPPGTETYSSAGGSITVQWDGVALDLQTTTPAAGFEAEVEDDRPDRVRVRFRGAGGDVRIELRVEDGRVVRVE